jgi:hypothetical protein
MTNLPQEAATPAEADQADVPLFHDPFRQCRPGLAPDFSREDRIRLIGQFSESVLRGEAPSKEASMLVAAGLAAWLERGGSLTRDYWRVAGPQGCTVTESILWRRMKAVVASSITAHEFPEPSKLESVNQIQDGSK